MSAYRDAIGLTRPASVRVGGDIGSDPLVWFPGAISAELNRIRIVLDGVNVDVSAAAAAKPPNVSSAEWNNWHDLYLQVHQYLDNASTLTGSTVAQARTFEQQVTKWRDLLKSRGVKNLGVDQAKGPDGGMPFWIYPAMAIGGIVAVTSLIGAVKK